MLLLQFTPIPQTVCCQSSSSRINSDIASNAFSRVNTKSIHLQTQLFNSPHLQVLHVRKQRDSTIMKASSDIDGAEPEIPSETKEESVPVEELPLESKLQLKLDQKTKMKLAKKIRLRRKRLVQKRQLRKKGRWPPSKMKKNKNV